MDTLSDRAADAPGEAGAGARLLLRLYVAGSAPNSRRAHANLLALLERAGVRDYRLEVVDCIREPQRALRDGVLVTPTLLKLNPPPRETVIGTLSDARKVALSLGLLDPSPDLMGQRAEGGGRRENTE